MWSVVNMVVVVHLHIFGLGFLPTLQRDIICYMRPTRVRRNGLVTVVGSILGVGVRLRIRAVLVVDAIVLIVGAIAMVGSGLLWQRRQRLHVARVVWIVTAVDRTNGVDSVDGVHALRVVRSLGAHVLLGSAVGVVSESVLRGVYWINMIVKDSFERRDGVHARWRRMGSTGGL